MPHAHIPHVEDDEESSVQASSDPEIVPLALPRDTRKDRSRWLLKIALEVVLISVGVFLALMGEQWRESAHTRELAEASLRGFRSEILANQKAVAAVRDYHVTLLESLRAYLAAELLPQIDRALGESPAR